MHEKDRRKILKAGFTLYRCSEVEKVIKKRTIEDASWKIEMRVKTKAAIKRVRSGLLLEPKSIQV